MPVKDYHGRYLRKSLDSLLRQTSGRLRRDCAGRSVAIWLRRMYRPHVAATVLVGAGLAGCMGSESAEQRPRSGGARVQADRALRAREPALERPTLRTLGVRLPFTGDADGDASVAMRVRRLDARRWRRTLPLLRVDPAGETGHRGEPPAVGEFAGSALWLRPATSYEIELKVADPDGVRRRLLLRARTREVPRAPLQHRTRSVGSARELRTALRDARPGDIISLSGGVYRGTFAVRGSGTAQRPIVVRGAARNRTVLDGGGCAECNVLTVYGSFVQVERLTLRSAQRALKFQGNHAQGNVARRIRIRDTDLGIGIGPPQRDLYICDNDLQGRLRWPLTYADDGGGRASHKGIVVWGEGHVVCHNRIGGYSDALNVGSGDRADDFYGNEIRSSYDNAIEFDRADGNVRFFGNRVENTFAPLSAQPVFRGPAYYVRNVVLGTADEQLKFKALGDGADAIEPSGMLVYNNTFVSPYTALLLENSGGTAHNFRIENNIFFGPEPGTSPWWPDVVHWTGRIDDGVFDHNGYYPDGGFRLGGERFRSFAALRRSGRETHGVLLGRRTFARFPPLRDHRQPLTPRNAVLHHDSRAVDRGRVLPGVTDGYLGAASDLGALERGSRPPRYGPRSSAVR
jgi:hypothetical protein